MRGSRRSGSPYTIAEPGGRNHPRAAALSGTRNQGAPHGALHAVMAAGRADPDPRSDLGVRRAALIALGRRAISLGSAAPGRRGGPFPMGWRRVADVG